MGLNRQQLLEINGITPVVDGVDTPQTPLNVNVFDWHACDVADAGDSDGEGDDNCERGKTESTQSNGNGKYTIYAFGVCADGKSACIEIPDFPAYFFVKWIGWPQQQQQQQPSEIHAETMRLQRYLKENVRDLKSANIHIRKDYWGFNDDREIPFIQLVFDSLRSMRSAAYCLSRNQTSGNRSLPRGMNVKVYESKIDPLLRFMHIREVQPVGWVNVPSDAWATSSMAKSMTTCHHYARCSYKQICPADAADQSRGLAPLVIASFDIECTSSHGDFPVAKKDYTRLAMELETLWDYEDMSGQSEYAVKKRLTDAVDYAMGCGDVQIREGVAGSRLIVSRLLLKPFAADDATKKAMRDFIRRVVDEVYLALHNRQKRSASSEDVPSVIQALADLLNKSLGRFYSVEGDPIIQIGTTLGVYGSKLGHCSTRVIFTLGSCLSRPSEADTLIVREFEREEDMLMAWLELVRDVDPDVITGYNILGFDIAYIHERAGELSLRPSRFLRFGRLNDKPSVFTELQLSSSALGDNILKYFDMHGRVYVDLLKVVQRDYRLDSYKLDSVAEHFLGERKNDVSPNDIFRLQKGTAEDRRVIADYCVQDCELCNRLIAKLETIANSVGMANVCVVPLSFIFMRGQGIKIFSLVAKHCRDTGYLIPDVQKPPDANPARSSIAGEEVGEEEGYEGAIVLEPDRGMHLDTPVSVLDYNSLYPSSMISHNISHNSIVLDPKHDNLPDVEYVTVSYDLYGPNKEVVGRRDCRYVTKVRGQAYDGVLPRILKQLLAQRKATRKQAEAYLRDGDRFRHALCDGQQLAYKVTANSLYGQMGARTSKLYLKDIAACTTAVGRAMIMLAKKFVEDEFGARVIYGDTDSIFVTFPEASPRTVGKSQESQDTADGSTIRSCLAASIAAGQRASERIRPLLPPPHNLEYEKTFFPFVLLSKKRYVGLLYTDDADGKPVQKSMGIALKRRDYAPIVKKIYGGVIDVVLQKRDIPAAVEFLRDQLFHLVRGEFDLGELVISKTLRSMYKFPRRIPHVVLARRMHDRDPGSEPQVNDRVPYVFVKTRKHNALMGERIEHIDYVRAHPEEAEIDTLLYIQSQIMKPCLQLLACALEQLPGYSRLPYLSGPEALSALVLEKDGNTQKAQTRLDDLREAEVRRMIFDPFTKPLEREHEERVSVDKRQQKNRANRQMEITCFLKSKPQ